MPGSVSRLSVSCGNDIIYYVQDIINTNVVQRLLLTRGTIESSAGAKRDVSGKALCSRGTGMKFSRRNFSQGKSKE
jgi:hypothetical protein